jgi:hypothetical protein
MMAQRSMQRRLSRVALIVILHMLTLRALKSRMFSIGRLLNYGNNRHHPFLL